MKTPKIFTSRMLWVATYLGGPLLAGYIMAHNYKAFGQTQRAQQAWIGAIVVFILLFVVMASLPESVNIPNYLIPLVYTGIAALIFHNTLQPEVDQHLEQDGAKESGWRVVGATAVGLIVTVVLAMVTFILLDLFAPV